MTSFAPGTPPEVIAAVEKQFAERFKNAGIPMPPAPDIKNPFYDSPVRPDMPRQTLNPRQLRDQALASAKEARDKALQASRAIEAGGQRLAAKKSALGDYNKARDAAQQQYQYMKTLPKKTTIIGGDVIKPGRDYIPPPREQINGRTATPEEIAMLTKTSTTVPTNLDQNVIGRLGMKKGGKVKKYAAGGLMKPIAPDIKSPLYPGPVRKKPPMPPAPDIKSPLRDAPSGLVSTQTTMKPRQYMKHQIQGAKQVREQQLDAVRKMQDRAQRQQFKQVAQKDFENARNAARQQYRATKLGPRTGGDMLPNLDQASTQKLIDARRNPNYVNQSTEPYDPGYLKKGGSVKKYAAGGSVKSSSPMKSSASKRADGCAIKGKTRGRIV